MIIDISNTQKRYDIIYTDPPWPQTKSNLRKTRPNQRKNLDYQTCDISEIKHIHSIALALCNAKHNVFMWTIDKYLHDAEEMMLDLGYRLHARMIWDKKNGIAPAFTVRFAHEYLLWFYRKGNMLMPDKALRGKYTTVMREPSTIHSVKPLAAYVMIEQLFPRSGKLELFARNCRDGWDCWGNELERLIPQEVEQ